MSFFKRLVGSLFGGGRGGAREDRTGVWIYVRCDACGEKIRLRIDREHDLSAEFEGTGSFPTSYHVHKEVVGRNCFRRIPVDITFNAQREPVEYSIKGGTFITAEEYAAGATTGPPG